LSIRSWRSLVAHDVQQRPGQIGFGRCFFEQPTGVGRAGVGTARLLALRFGSARPLRKAGVTIKRNVAEMAKVSSAASAGLTYDGDV
jgi:hypothetical protein